MNIFTIMDHLSKYKYILWSYLLLLFSLTIHCVTSIRFVCIKLRTFRIRQIKLLHTILIVPHSKAHSSKLWYSRIECCVKRTTDVRDATKTQFAFFILIRLVEQTTALIILHTSSIFLLYVVEVRQASFRSLARRQTR